MRVVVVAHAFPPYKGGLSYVTEHLSVNLVRMGFDVEVVTLDVTGGLPRYEEYHGVHVRRFRGYAPDNCYFIPSAELVRYLKGVEADVVHVHNIGSALTPVAVYAVGRGTSRPRVVVSPHHHESGSKWHAKVAWLFYRSVAREALRRADVVHSVSEYEASLIKRDFGLEAVVIPNGVCEDVFNFRWSPPKGRVVLTYAGRVERYKRVDLVLRVALELARSNVDVTIRVIGDGPELGKVVKLARESGVDLEAPGFLPRREYLEALSRSTALVNLSDYEAFSIVAAEALAMGVPAIVAKPWGRTFEGIRGAYVVDKRDIREVVEAVAKVCGGVDDPNHSSKLDERVRILPWRQVVEQIVRKLYL